MLFYITQNFQSQKHVLKKIDMQNQFINHMMKSYFTCIKKKKNQKFQHIISLLNSQ